MEQSLYGLSRCLVSMKHNSSLYALIIEEAFDRYVQT